MPQYPATGQIPSRKPARAARPRPENHAGIRPGWTCLVKGPDRSVALRALDETSPVWRPAWQGFQGWLCPARAGAIGACHHLFLPLEYNWGGDFGLMGACHHLFGEPHHSAPRQAQDAINCVRPRLFVKFF